MTARQIAGDKSIRTTKMVVLRNIRTKRIFQLFKCFLFLFSELYYHIWVKLNYKCTTFIRVDDFPLSNNQINTISPLISCSGHTRHNGGCHSRCDSLFLCPTHSPAADEKNERRSRSAIPTGQTPHRRSVAQRPTVALS